jgi:glycosyltransferase involved in cell wall biosynthesis
VRWIVVSFEGPDPWAQAGGLATRVQGLTEELAHRRFDTTLFFFGDPHRPPTEITADGCLTLHRWGQWLSAIHRGGIYDGEAAKVRDLNESLPQYLADRVIGPAVAAGEECVVLAEEWQTAAFVIGLDALLRERGWRDRVTLLWNANNPYGFDGIDWSRLSHSAILLAVSRYMRGILRSRGVDSLVAPNGLSERLLAKKPDPNQVRRLRRSRRRRFFKMARWESEKGWDQALDAVATLRRRGKPVGLIARSGGPSGSGGGIETAATARGFAVAEVNAATNVAQLVDRLEATSADVVSLRFPVNEDLAGALFGGAIGVLANSVSEPFGLVGLEAMAAGGVVFTGGTGEDYAIADRNAVVLESTSAAELADRALWLWSRPNQEAALRRRARQTALGYTWSVAVDRLLTIVRTAQRGGLSGIGG